MPYIKEADRFYLDLGTLGGLGKSCDTPGELNYVLTQIINGYWKNGQNYQCINDVLGALEGSKLEFYRRVAAPYEDQKIQENGDVY